MPNVGLTDRPALESEARVAGIRILVVDDHRLFSSGLRSVLQERGFEVVGVAASGTEAIALARAKEPHLVLMDLGLPDIDGLTAGQRILAERPETKVLALTALEDAGLAREAVRAGFHGYIMKHASVSDLLGAIAAAGQAQAVMPREVAQAMLEDGDREEGTTEPLLARHLTRREREVLALLTAGASGREIAEHLFISPNTARTHIQNILSKLQVHSRLEAVAYAARHGLNGRLVVERRGSTAAARRGGGERSKGRKANGNQRIAGEGSK